MARGQKNPPLVIRRILKQLPDYWQNAVRWNVVDYDPPILLVYNYRLNEWASVVGASERGSRPTMTDSANEPEILAGRCKIAGLLLDRCRRCGYRFCACPISLGADPFRSELENFRGTNMDHEQLEFVGESLPDYAWTTD